ncbi:MAG TPA: PEP/pyruvate-binding domain-containing protein [Anaerolineae bacterium]
MAIQSLRTTTPTIDVYIKLAQYPILRDRIRLRMREELFRRGIVSRSDFEREVKELAIESQRREGLTNPYAQEDETAWQKRIDRIRDFHTDAYFANNLGSSLLDRIIDEVLRDQPTPTRSIELTFNPEIAPWELLFRQGEVYEALPPPEKEKAKHHLEELKVVLIKRLISDQLPFIGVAKKVFTVADLHWIYQQLIGAGRIGGKAAGMVLAWKILQQTDPDLGPDISQFARIPESFFIGSEVIYEFILINKLEHFVNQKYLPLEEIRAGYPRVVDAFLAGEFPRNIVEQLGEILEQTGPRPLIVRSSSLLEDHFTHSFTGKYKSCFCPNQGSDEENLQALLDAVRLVYASTFNPDAMVARQEHGLIDYDERMAVILQPLSGHRYGRHFLPPITGLGYSRNPLHWDAQIRAEEGLLRLVWGFAERVTDPLKNEDACLIALSHPQLRAETTVDGICQIAQQHVNVIDLEENRFVTLPIQDILRPNYPYLRYIASVNKGDRLQDIRSQEDIAPADRLVLTFNVLTKDWKFVKLMRTTLMRLEKVYGRPVEVEFAVDILMDYSTPDYRLHVLQCRPLSDGAT